MLPKNSLICVLKENPVATKSVTAEQKCLTHVRGKLSNNAKILRSSGNTKFLQVFDCGKDTVLKLL